MPTRPEVSAPDTIRILIVSPDRAGIIAAVTSFIEAQGGNIVEADQHTDPDTHEFSMRLEIEKAGFGLGETDFDQAFAPLVERYGMAFRVEWSTRPKRMAVMVTREGHCLNDLLYRWRLGELGVEVPLVIGNHPDLAGDATWLDIPFHHLPVSRETKPEQEAQVLALLREADADFVVLARYMQVLSPEFVAQMPGRIINIHHSFLPAFAGPRPYHRAFERGVKLIGATSHYVTDDLDEGPIIAQATTPVDHRDTLADLMRKGRDLERMVLAEAVRLHVDDRVIVAGRRTIVFD
jgi:formyltetrahydrofolate deformylase